MLACTDGSGVMTVAIHDDLNSAVVIKQCDVRCDQTHETDRLSPGQSVAVNTSYNNVDNYWMVFGPDGGLIGCLDLVFSKRQDGVVVGVTSARACPT